MPTPGRPRSTEPQRKLSVRLPAALVERIEAEAAATGATLSDAVRAHLIADPLAQLRTPKPRRRTARLAAVSGADPALLRQLASLGGLVNQVARVLNVHAAAGQAVDVFEALVTIRVIEQHLHALVKAETMRRPCEVACT